MDAKVKEFLDQKQAEEAAVLLQTKQRLLNRLGLVEQVKVEKEDGFDYQVYDKESQRYVYYKYVYPEITDEEYKKLLKYDPLLQDLEPENNGENALYTLSAIYLVLSMIGCVICCCLAIEEGHSFFVSGIILLISGLILYWVVKVFTNISRKSTDIYNLLKEKNQ